MRSLVDFTHSPLSSSNSAHSDSVIETNNLVKFEGVMLMNLCPEDAEEAIALVPSLAAKFSVDDLQVILEDLIRARKVQ